MAITTINIGNNANDGLGDNLRTAFEKVNANFTELSSSFKTVSVTAPTSPSGYSVFTGINGTDLKFKDLAAGRNITFNETPNSVIVSSTATMFSKVSTATSEVDSVLSSTLKFAGDADINITLTQPIAGGINPPTPAIPGVVNVRSNIPIGQLIKTYDFGQLDNVIHNVFQLYLATTTVDFGTITSPNPLKLDMGTIL